MQSKVLPALERFIFKYRFLIIICFVALTIGFAISLSNLRLDAGFNKLLPLKHEYMQTFTHYHSEFGGANRILVAVMVKEGDIFTAEYFSALNSISDDIFFISGIKRSQIRSLFTPNVRFTEVVEDGISGGNVIPDDFIADEVGFEIVKQNIYKADIIGRFVANDFSGSIVSAQLQEIDPNTGKKLDYFLVAEQLEKTIRQKYENLYPELDIHIIGYAKFIGDIADGAKKMVWFFLFTIIIITLLVIYYAQSFIIALITIVCSLITVVWQLGLLPILDFGIDPMSMLVPFLIFAIGVSHAMQMVCRIQSNMVDGTTVEQACRNSFRSLFVPGMIALLSDTVGFVTILVIDIGIIREMAITASIGVALIILTNLIILPLLLSYIHLDEGDRKKIINRMQWLKPLWSSIAKLTDIKNATVILMVALIILVMSFLQGHQIKIGDQHRGVPELHAHSQYNIDSELISHKFSIGVDVLNVIVEADSQACIQYEAMRNIDEFTWHVKNLPGVKDVVSLPTIAKHIHAGWNEGYIKWRELPRNQSVLTQSIAPVPTSSGLLNPDCSVMSVMIFTVDHKQQTIDSLISGIKEFIDTRSDDAIRFRLATGNVGVMAASNEEVKNAQFPILIYVFAAIILLCFSAFRSLSSIVIIVLPLALVSIMTYAVMSLMQIGLKVNTLPVVALGIGIGVDYGIYLYSRLLEQYQKQKDIYSAYVTTLSNTGYSILFTGVTLSIGVLSWVFSPLKFQSDMGVLLVFMFFVNMLAALLLIPALQSIYIHFIHTEK